MSGIMSELDPKGRVVVFMGAIQTAGFGAGPAIAAMLLTSDSYSRVNVLGIALIMTSLFFVLSLILMQRLQTASTAKHVTQTAI